MGIGHLLPARKSRPLVGVRPSITNRTSRRRDSVFTAVIVFYWFFYGFFFSRTFSVRNRRSDPRPWSCSTAPSLACSTDATCCCRWYSNTAAPYRPSGRRLVCPTVAPTRLSSPRNSAWASRWKQWFRRLRRVFNACPEKSRA